MLKLRNKTIVNACISQESSPLIFELNDDLTFYMHGYNEQYESWDIGVAFIDEHWKVISMPGGEIVGIVPDKYKTRFVSYS